MPRVLVAALVLALAASLVAAGPTGDPPSQAVVFSVGTGVAPTEPDGQLCIGGYGVFCNRPSQGIKDPLRARALAVSSQRTGDTVIVVTTTAVGLFAKYKDTLGDNGISDIRERIAAETGVPPGNVVVVSDHSHAAPDTIGIWGGVDEAYMTVLADGAVAAAVEAHDTRRPARLSHAAVEGPTLDSSYSEGSTDDAAMDDEFRVLFADAPSGERIATFVNYAPHATVCGDCDDLLSGDWPAWAAQEAETLYGGTGFGAVGALGATDWRKSGDLAEREAEARDRIRRLLAAAEQAAVPVRGDEVAAQSTFLHEPLGQPVLALNYFPGFDVGEGDVRIDRATTPPYLTGAVIGTYAGILRLGDLAIATMPGEPFPQLHDALRDGGIADAAHVWLLGAAQDFLGYMTADDETYRQTVEEGALYLAGCPEEELYDALGHDHDGACPDHWTLQVSPTIGAHVVCTILDAADTVGFTSGPRDERCPALTALDGVADPLDPSTPEVP